jgi:hypothetical protein
LFDGVSPVYFVQIFSSFDHLVLTGGISTGTAHSFTFSVDFKYLYICNQKVSDRYISNTEKPVSNVKFISLGKY